MRLVFVTLVDITGTSGQNLYSRAIVTALSEHPSVQLTVVCPRPSERLPPELREVEMRCLPRKRTQNLSWQVSSQLYLLRQLFEIDAGRGIEVVASPLKPAMLVPPVFCAAMNVDYVTLLEGVISKNVRRNDPFPLAGPIADAVSWLNFSISECVFAAHSSAYAWARKIAPSSTPVREFTHAVDTDVFKPADQKESRRKLGIPDQSDIVIGFVGSFKPYHLVENLIHAIDRLDEQGVRVHGLLVGDGPERDQVLSVAEKYGLEDRITAPGFVPQEDVYKYVAASDLMYGLIDPDHWDSPMKVYEYAACARPVIIHGESETSFVNEIGAGITVNSTSPDSIAEGIGEFLSTPEEERKAMGSRGRTYVEDMPSWDDLAAAIVACANSGS